MRFFIDTANTSLIKELSDLNMIDGVTTNPSLMAKEGIKDEACIAHYIHICKLTNGPVSAEVIATDFNGMLEEGLALAKLHKNIVVKIPMTKNGVQTIQELTSKGIKTNCTLVFSAAQALLAAKAGATYVSPFIGRLEDVEEDGLELIKSIRTIFDNYQLETQILAASIRNQNHIVKCAELGADVVTAPYALLNNLFDHPLTTKGLEQFLADHASLNQ
ncbi:fructose-6-phosphate aldolase [Flavobacteriales bacterium]|nr:fructose-6-phosphate aldolase [Flavobacteriales bacterium]